MSDKIRGMGHSVKRKEDPRFLRGKGNYVDDVKLPGMLYLDIVRSPYAHAKITNIDSSKALAIPGVLAVITGKDLDAAGLAWMPTLMSDKQMVLPIEKVVYQSQEVAAVVATERYLAADGMAAVEIEYEPLPVVVDPKKATEPGATLVRDDREAEDQPYLALGGRRPRDHRAGVRRGRGAVTQDIVHPAHPRLLDRDMRLRGAVRLDQRQADGLDDHPGAARHPHGLLAGLGHRRAARSASISPDIGGGFGGKVPVYPGYVIAVVAAITTGKPVKWIEDRMENLQADSFARDYWITAELAAKKDGTMTALRTKVIADHGAFDAAANPSKFPAGLYSICTGSYDLKQAFVEVDGVFTNKPPGGVAYRCSFRVTEAVHMIERMADILAHDLNIDPADLRLKNFIPADAFPYKSPTGWEYDSGNYEGALHLAMERIGYRELRKEQAEKRARGELMGIGISSFTEIVGAGPSHTFDILGLKMFDSCEVRIHPTGSAIARIGVQTQGQGHETTFAQILAEELGLPVENIEVEHGDTDTAPYGLGTYASRSTPTAGAAAAMAARKIREKAKKLAAHLLEANEADIEWNDYKFSVKGSPDRSKTMTEIAFAAYTNHPLGMEAGLEAVSYYDPPNLTFPFGSYICVVDIDRGTGAVKVRRFMAVDDCGNIINPMIVEGQIHGGLTMGLAPALYEEIVYDENGANLTGSLMDYLVPTAVETPNWEAGKTCTPSPHHPFGAKGVGESATVGAPPAIANAVVDALWHLGVRHIDIPITPQKVWALLDAAGAAE